MQTICRSGCKMQALKAGHLGKGGRLTFRAGAPPRSRQTATAIVAHKHHSHDQQGHHSHGGHNHSIAANGNGSRSGEGAAAAAVAPAKAPGKQHDHHDHDHHHEHHHHDNDHHNHDHAHDHHHNHDHGHDHDHSHGHGHGRVPAAWRPRNPELPRGAAAGKVLFLDAYASGVAGDMLTAALLDLGVPLAAVEGALACLELEGFRVGMAPDQRSGIVSGRFVVEETAPQPFRDYAQVRSLLARLPPGVRAIAEAAFRRLAEAEAGVHGMPLAEVHFHEVGAVDSIVDVVAASAALDYLGLRLPPPPPGAAAAGDVDGISGGAQPSLSASFAGGGGRHGRGGSASMAVAVSPLPMGRGMVRGAAHGPLPNPPPAVLAVLCGAGIATFDAGCDAELVTPTGACLVAAATGGGGGGRGGGGGSCCRWPAMAPLRCGYGIGTKAFGDRPNVFRVVLGDPVEGF